MIRVRPRSVLVPAEESLAAMAVPVLEVRVVPAVPVPVDQAVPVEQAVPKAPLFRFSSSCQRNGPLRRCSRRLPSDDVPQTMFPPAFGVFGQIARFFGRSAQFRGSAAKARSFGGLWPERPETGRGAR